MDNNKKLYKICCAGKVYLSMKSFDDIYVIADTIQEAHDKSLNKMKELEYTSCVLKVELVADEKESNHCLLII